MTTTTDTTATDRRPYLGQGCRILAITTLANGNTLHGLKLEGATGCLATQWNGTDKLTAIARRYRLRFMPRFHRDAETATPWN